MSVFMTPDGKPFFGGIYFPPRDGMRGVCVGFVTVVRELARVYAEEKDRALCSAEEISCVVKMAVVLELFTGDFGIEVLHRAMSGFAGSFDAIHNNLRHTPKFPSSLSIPFLLHY